MKKRKKILTKTLSLINRSAVSIYENYAGRGRGFLLESYDRNYDRYCFMGRDPEEMIRASADGLEFVGREGSRSFVRGNPLQLLKDYMDEYEVDQGHSDLFFTGGLVGALGYDFVRYLEDLPDDNPDEIGIGPVQLFLVTEFLVIDHLAETMTAVVLSEDREEALVEGEKKLKEMLDEALGQDQTDQTDTGSEKSIEQASRESGQDLPEPDGRIVSRTDDPDSYCRKVEKIKDYIVEGHVFQTVLSQRWTIETGQDGFDLYKKLRDLNPSPYMYYFRFDDFEIIGSSPEMIVRHRDQKLVTNPIAGTRPRGATPEEDEDLARSLLADPKELAEHVMLVDLARNDMGRIARFGSVKVRDFMHIRKYSHVMHLISMVEGKKAGQYHPIDLVSAFLPAGTLSGAPKVRAMEIIDELESVRRGLYGGAVGYIDFNGDVDFCITIRTMIKKDNLVYIQAGAGIVADSDPASEYEECCNKAGALAKVLIARGGVNDDPAD